MLDAITADDRETQEIERAVELIHLGARLHLLECETTLSRERLLALYEEVVGSPPPAEGPQVPANWFLEWQPNIHAALFIGIWRYLKAFAGARGIDAIANAYRFYMDHMQATGLDPILTVTRAWTLVGYLDVLLGVAPCRSCGGELIVESRMQQHELICGLCRARQFSEPVSAHVGAGSAA